MAARKFKFISPGIYTNEVDESIITPTPPIMGPAIVGRTRKGPAMRPIRVDNYQEFVEVFGDPVPGPEAGDIWRNDTPLGPSYAAYAAKAWLNANVSPATVVRVLGEDHDNRDSLGTLAGWKTTQGDSDHLHAGSHMMGSVAGTSASGSAVGGAFGMWVFDATALDAGVTDGTLASGLHQGDITGTLAAVWYCPSGSLMMMKGTPRDGGASLTGTAVMVKSAGVNNRFTTVLRGFDASDDASATRGAVGRIKFTDDTMANYDDETFTLESTDGTRVVYTLDDDTAHGSSTYTHTAVNIGIQGLANKSALASKVQESIAHTDGGHSGKITAGTNGSDTVTLEQVVPGPAGNTTIETTTTDGDMLITSFHHGSFENAITFDFDFDETGGRYIRDVFNTNPVLTNSDVVSSDEVTSLKNRYWLGETFDRQLKEGAGSTSTGYQYAVILPMLSKSLGNAQGVNWAYRQSSFVNPKTGWFFSQDFGEDTKFSAPETTTRLFRFVSRDYGTEGHKHKIAIEDIKASPNEAVPFGSFTVAVYPVGTTDKNAKYEALEKFTGCNLNPNSRNYVAKRIGDRYLSWNYSLEKHIEIGQYKNQSQYIRIEMNPALDVDFNQASLPFGVSGPIRPQTAYYVSGGVAGQMSGSIFTDKYYKSNSTPGVKSWITNIGPPIDAAGLKDIGIGNSYLTGGMVFGHYPSGHGHQLIMMGATKAGVAFSGTFPFPATAIRSSSADGPGAGPGKEAYFGVSTTKTKHSKNPDPGITDYLRGLPFDSAVDGRFEELTGLPDGTEYSWVFSLDDIVINKVTGDGEYVSGSRNRGTSCTAENTYKKVLEYHDRFWTVMAGGHDGFDITEAEPLRNSQWTVGTTTQYTHYAWNSVHRALGTIADQDVVEYNLISAPGITNDDLTDRVMEIAEERADALAIIDLKDVFKPSTENTDSFETNLGSVTSTVSSIKSRELDTSYGCAYYPWAQIRDTKNGRLVWVPPSVVALGAMASSEASTAPWFAPAGYIRGNLSAGAAGMPTVSISEQLTLKQRDKLYLNNINPIANFPNEGIVIFGQKTLQSTPSALDRINVRRLMIYLKKEISRMSTQVLFDNNVESTWNRFKGMVNPFLSGVQSQFGVTDYKVILDESTTTPDLIDRNILYAKIYIKPARAIEFIAIDFIISKTGASFED